MPSRVICAPDVLARLCEIFEPVGSHAHAHALRLSHRGAAIVAGILAPGTIVVEGEVDDVRMGDW